MQEINPLLSEDACQKLYSLCQVWQVHCVLLDKVTRCLHNIQREGNEQAAGNSLAAVANELSNRGEWSCMEHPEWLAFEVLQRIMIRPHQHTVASQLLDNLDGPGFHENDRGAVLQVYAPHALITELGISTDCGS